MINMHMFEPLTLKETQDINIMCLKNNLDMSIFRVTAL